MPRPTATVLPKPRLSGMERVGAAAKAAAGAATQVAERTSVVAAAAGGVAASAAAKAGAESANVAMQQLKHGRTAAMAVVADQKERMIRKKEEWHETLECFLKTKLLKIVERVIERLPAVAKDLLEDPDMPRVVSRGKDRAVDAMWPDIKHEIMWELAVLIDKEDSDKKDEEEAGPDCIRAFFRYHLYPNDKTFWGKIRDPVWVLFTLISLVPVSGLCPIIFFLIFVILDKADEYQLIFYILTFKGTQFLSHGVIRTIMGFFVFLSCVTAPGMEDQHHCDVDGPGMAGIYEIEVGGFVVQVLLVWTAFVLIPCSKDKGRSTLRGHVDVEPEARHAGVQGGYLRYFMVYDLICALLCAIPVGIVATIQSDYKDWRVMHTVFAAQVVYGYLSLPFFLFTLPFLQVLLTHSVPTAYDKMGRVRKFTRPAVEDKREKIEESREPLVNMTEAERLFDKLMHIGLGGKTSSVEEESSMP